MFKSNFSNNKFFRIACLLLIIVFVLSITAVSVVALKFNESHDLDIIKYQEVENVATIIGASEEEENSVSTVSLVNGLSNVEERYFALYDFDNTKKYLYIEYLDGGFAIYDRLGEFVYEKSNVGKGPFDSYKETDIIYYGGPSYYYTTQKSKYQHIVTGDVISREDANSMANELNLTRKKYVDKQLSELSLFSASNRASDQLFMIGHNFKESNENEQNFKLNVQMYFTLKMIAQQYGGYEQYDTMQIWNMNTTDTPYEYPFIDWYCGRNEYGSCGYVALSTTLLFYDRLGIAKMVNNQNNWHLMYDYSIKTTNPTIGAFLNNSGIYYTGMISQVPKNYLTSEFLHQELLYLQYPEKRGVNNYDETTFGSTPENRKSAYEKYCATNGVTKYGYSVDSGTYKLPEKIVNGNLCIVGIKKGAPYVNGNHSVVAYAFEGQKPWWYTVSSIMCDYGWDRSSSNDPIYAGISVNVNFINRNECIKVYNY